MNPEEAVQANVTSTAALREVVGPCTHLVHVSTAFADGKCGSRESRDLGDYRNAYEWSKACAERIVIEQFSPVTIIRPPLIIGRRSDGYIARFTGFYTLLRAVITGLAPLMVGQPDGYLELIPVDDVAAEIVKACLGARPDVSRVVILGRGNLAMSVATTMSVGCEAINNWRTRHDATSLSLPPMITPDRWERFLLPFARSHLSARQLDVIEALSSFVPYLSIAAALRPTIVIEDVAAPLRRSVYFWAERNRVAALRHPAPWVMERSR
jgi:nucleoside-diphosphate-sugar epimerase